MKWDKYAKLIGHNPDIATMLASNVGPPSLRLAGYHSDFTLPQWVEQKLKYVAVRPWGALDMNAVDISRRLPAGSSSMQYVIYFHVANTDPRPCYRARYLDVRGEALSVGEAMKDVARWHQSYWAKQGDYPLVFGAVLRKALLWREVGRWTSEVVEETVNIWLTPTGFQL